MPPPVLDAASLRRCPYGTEPSDAQMDATCIP
eukprot:CAMPEP_0181213390 /NCGR_PEP_ID=MMETSP1096-20121128/24875_1 /TAXON_ID=156174 ORGANISM="Chrysochromulina ericina, Strain CCMP281" /NCGR_SAMPLE_ID=MMETSP1096 /ASSEMBLY_ACC=CAM_ASM_000453 /LENGTH=31 /DNA_ID= /DNA_START= /DNA_END= /DNA_ORIENTATION=